jgi:hypothetical protein
VNAKDIRRTIDIMTRGGSPAEQVAAFREDGQPFGCGLQHLVVGDRVRALGYLEEDGWATVIQVRSVERAVVVLFETDGETCEWRWGPRGGGGHVLVENNPQ